MHAIWKGALSFGLVNIPVRVYSASLSRELKFKLLHKKDLGEIRYARICKTDGKEVPWEEIVKGYATQEGRYVIMTEEDFEKANLKKSRTIEILDFTDENQIDTIYYDTPYYLEPEKSARAPYTLLFEALKRTKKVAVGRIVFHHKEHIGVIRVHENILVLHQLRYEGEIRNYKDLDIAKVPVTKTELAMAIQLIEARSKPFKPKDYSDSYTDEIRSIIKKKGKGEKISGKKERLKPTQNYDVLSLLKKSLEQPSKKSKRRKAA